MPRGGTIPTAIKQTRDLLQKRLAEIADERGQLERALRHLQGPAARRARKGKPSGKRKAGGGKRAVRGQRRQQLLEALKAKPGSTSTEIAKKLEISAGQVSALLGKARAERLVIKKGKGYALKK